MNAASATTPPPEALPVRRVETSAPLKWLNAGARDMMAMPVPSLAYGAIFSLIGYVLVNLTTQHPHLLSAAVSGFFLAGPFLGMGLYRLSQRREAGKSINLLDSMTAWRENIWSIGLFGVLLAFILLSWERISAILFALFYGDSLPTTDGGWMSILISTAEPGFLVTYLIIGAALAALVFTLSVIALPLLLTGPYDPVTAAITSVRATLANPSAMALWALLIVLLVGIGMATFFLGLMITMPLVAHATWHAFRDVTQEVT